MSLKELSESASTPVKTKVRHILELARNSEVTLPDLSVMTVLECVQSLKTIRNDLPNKSPYLSKVDSILIPLMELDYHNTFEIGPFDLKPKLLFPTDSDTVLSDLNEQLLFTKVSDLLKIRYLSQPTEAWDWKTAVSGIVYGEFSRPMISLPVNLSNQDPLMLHFLVDTGSPKTEIPVAALEKLHGKPLENIPSAFYGFIGGIRVELGTCSPSGNHSDIPLLGQDFLTLMRAKLEVDYFEKTVTIATRFG